MLFTSGMSAITGALMASKYEQQPGYREYIDNTPLLIPTLKSCATWLGFK